MHQAIMRKFPQEIQEFGMRFAVMQEERERADYDPLVQFFRTDVLQRIQETEDAISKFKSERIDDKSRRAFAVLVLLERRA